MAIDENRKFKEKVLAHQKNIFRLPWWAPTHLLDNKTPSLVYVVGRDILLVMNFSKHRIIIFRTISQSYCGP